MIEAAQRSVFIVDSDGIIAYKWVRDGDNPDFEEFVSGLRDEVAKLRGTDRTVSSRDHGRRVPSS